MKYIQLKKEKLPDDPCELVLKLFGGIKKKLSGVRVQIQERSIPDSSKDELITYYVKAFRKNSEVSKNKKTALSSGDTIGTTEFSGFGSGTCLKCAGSFTTCSVKTSTENKCYLGRAVGLTTCGSCIFKD